jgi:hypothetical protein
MKLTLKVICDARGSDTLRKHDSTSLDSPTDQELGRLLVQVFGKINDSRIIYSSWEVVDVISQWTVSCDDDVLRLVNKRSVLDGLFEPYLLLRPFQ